MGGPEMAPHTPHTPHTLGAPRRSRGTPRYSDRLLVRPPATPPFSPPIAEIGQIWRACTRSASPHLRTTGILQAVASDGSRLARPPPPPEEDERQGREP